MASFSDKPTDPAVLGKARGGDMQAHESLYRQYASAVYGLAFRVVGSRAAAEDVLQETFVEVIRKIANLRRDSEFTAWLRRIALNKSLMYLRSAWHRKARPWVSEEALAATHEPAQVSAIGFSHEVQLQVDLERALERLPAITRSVLWLHDVEGYTHQEIAQLMGKTTSFSKSQVARAHQRLQAMLDDDKETESCVAVLKSC